jgi:hypothetical protein
VTVDAGLGNIARDCRVQIIPRGLYAKHGLDPAGWLPVSGSSSADSRALPRSSLSSEGLLESGAPRPSSTGP